MHARGDAKNLDFSKACSALRVSVLFLLSYSTFTLLFTSSDGDPANSSVCSLLKQLLKELENWILQREALCTIQS